MKAVLEIAAEEGWHGLTMRKIAERIRYSPPMIYACFQSKEALCGELVLEGFQRLHRHMSTAAAGLVDPLARLGALLKAIRTFAWENPAYYQAMFGLVPMARPGEQPRLGEYAGACLGLLADALVQAAAAGALTTEEPLRDAKALIAAGHGVIAMSLSGLVPDRREADALYDQVLRGLLSGFRR